MAKQFEHHLKSFDGLELHIHSWEVETPKGTLLITHGLAEHCGAYEKFAQEMNSDGWNVICWDMRGHGKSEGKRGYVNDFSDFINDLDLVIKFCKEKVVPADKPLILFGHSLGGLVLMKTIIDKGSYESKALCLSSPALGIAIDVPKLKVKAAEFAATWAPKLTLYNELKYEDLVRDDTLQKEYAKDPLRHEKISPRLFLGMQEAFEFVGNNTDKLSGPLIMQLAGVERVVSTPDSETIFEKLASPQKELFVYPDSHHECFNDLDRQDAFRDLKTFLNKQLV